MLLATCCFCVCFSAILSTTEGRSMIDTIQSPFKHLQNVKHEFIGDDSQLPEKKFHPQNYKRHHKYRPNYYHQRPHHPPIVQPYHHPYHPFLRPHYQNNHPFFHQYAPNQLHYYYDKVFGMHNVISPLFRPSSYSNIKPNQVYPMKQQSWIPNHVITIYKPVTIHFNQTTNPQSQSNTQPHQGHSILKPNSGQPASHAQNETNSSSYDVYEVVDEDTEEQNSSTTTESYSSTFSDTNNIHETTRTKVTEYLEVTTEPKNTRTTEGDENYTTTYKSNIGETTTHVYKTQDGASTNYEQEAQVANNIGSILGDVTKLNGSKLYLEGFEEDKYTPAPLTTESYGKYNTDSPANDDEENRESSTGEINSDNDLKTIPESIESSTSKAGEITPAKKEHVTSGYANEQRLNNTDLGNAITELEISLATSVDRGRSTTSSYKTTDFNDVIEHYVGSEEDLKDNGNSGTPLHVEISDTTEQSLGESKTTEQHDVRKNATVKSYSNLIEFLQSSQGAKNILEESSAVVTTVSDFASNPADVNPTSTHSLDKAYSTPSTEKYYPTPQSPNQSVDGDGGISAGTGHNNNGSRFVLEENSNEAETVQIRNEENKVPTSKSTIESYSVSSTDATRAYEHISQENETFQKENVETKFTTPEYVKMYSDSLHSILRDVTTHVNGEQDGVGDPAKVTENPINRVSLYGDSSNVNEPIHFENVVDKHILTTESHGTTESHTTDRATNIYFENRVTSTIHNVENFRDEELDELKANTGDIENLTSRNEGELTTPVKVQVTSHYGLIERENMDTINEFKETSTMTGFKKEYTSSYDSYDTIQPSVVLEESTEGYTSSPPKKINIKSDQPLEIVKIHDIGFKNHSYTSSLIEESSTIDFINKSTVIEQTDSKIISENGHLDYGTTHGIEKVVEESSLEKEERTVIGLVSKPSNVTLQPSIYMKNTYTTAAPVNIMMITSQTIDEEVKATTDQSPPNVQPQRSPGPTSNPSSYDVYEGIDEEGKVNTTESYTVRLLHTNIPTTSTIKNTKYHVETTETKSIISENVDEKRTTHTDSNSEFTTHIPTYKTQNNDWISIDSPTVTENIFSSLSEDTADRNVPILNSEDIEANLTTKNTKQNVTDKPTIRGGEENKGYSTTGNYYSTANQKSYFSDKTTNEITAYKEREHTQLPETNDPIVHSHGEDVGNHITSDSTTEQNIQSGTYSGTHQKDYISKVIDNTENDFSTTNTFFNLSNGSSLDDEIGVTSYEEKTYTQLPEIHPSSSNANTRYSMNYLASDLTTEQQMPSSPDYEKTAPENLYTTFLPKPLHSGAQLNGTKIALNNNPSMDNGFDNVLHTTPQTGGQSMPTKISYIMKIHGQFPSTEKDYASIESLHQTTAAIFDRVEEGQETTETNHRITPGEDLNVVLIDEATTEKAKSEQETGSSKSDLGLVQNTKTTTPQIQKCDEDCLNTLPNRGSNGRPDETNVFNHHQERPPTTSFPTSNAVNIENIVETERNVVENSTSHSSVYDEKRNFTNLNSEEHDEVTFPTNSNDREFSTMLPKENIIDYSTGGVGTFYEVNGFTTSTPNHHSLVHKFNTEIEQNKNKMFPEKQYTTLLPDKYQTMEYNEKLFENVIEYDASTEEVPTKLPQGVNSSIERLGEMTSEANQFQKHTTFLSNDNLNTDDVVHSTVISEEFKGSTTENEFSTYHADVYSYEDNLKLVTNLKIPSSTHAKENVNTPNASKYDENKYTTPTLPQALLSNNSPSIKIIHGNTATPAVQTNHNDMIRENSLTDENNMEIHKEAETTDEIEKLYEESATDHDPITGHASKGNSSIDKGQHSTGNQSQSIDSEKYSPITESPYISNNKDEVNSIRHTTGRVQISTSSTKLMLPEYTTLLPEKYQTMEYNEKLFESIIEYDASTEEVSTKLPQAVNSNIERLGETTSEANQFQKHRHTTFLSNDNLNTDDFVHSTVIGKEFKGSTTENEFSTYHLGDSYEDNLKLVTNLKIPSSTHAKENVNTPNASKYDENKYTTPTLPQALLSNNSPSIKIIHGNTETPAVQTNHNDMIRENSLTDENDMDIYIEAQTTDEIEKLYEVSATDHDPIMGHALKGNSLFDKGQHSTGNQSQSIDSEKYSSITRSPYISNNKDEVNSNRHTTDRLQISTSSTKLINKLKTGSEENGLKNSSLKDYSSGVEVTQAADTLDRVQEENIYTEEEKNVEVEENISQGNMTKNDETTEKHSTGSDSNDQLSNDSDVYSTVGVLRVFEELDFSDETTSPKGHSQVQEAQTKITPDDYSENVTVKLSNHPNPTDNIRPLIYEYELSTPSQRGVSNTESPERLTIRRTSRPKFDTISSTDFLPNNEITKHETTTLEGIYAKEVAFTTLRQEAVPSSNERQNYNILNVDLPAIHPESYATSIQRIPSDSILTEQTTSTGTVDAEVDSNNKYNAKYEITTDTPTTIENYITKRSQFSSTFYKEYNISTEVSVLSKEEAGDSVAFSTSIVNEGEYKAESLYTTDSDRELNIIGSNNENVETSKTDEREIQRKNDIVDDNYESNLTQNNISRNNVSGIKEPKYVTTEQSHVALGEKEEYNESNDPVEEKDILEQTAELNINNAEYPTDSFTVIPLPQWGDSLSELYNHGSKFENKFTSEIPNMDLVSDSKSITEFHRDFETGIKATESLSLEVFDKNSLVKEGGLSTTSPKGVAPESHKIMSIYKFNGGTSEVANNPESMGEEKLSNKPSDHVSFMNGHKLPDSTGANLNHDEFLRNEEFNMYDSDFPAVFRRHWFDQVYLDELPQQDSHEVNTPVKRDANVENDAIQLFDNAKNVHENAVHSPFHLNLLNMNSTNGNSAFKTQPNVSLTNEKIINWNSSSDSLNPEKNKLYIMERESKLDKFSYLGSTDGAIDYDNLDYQHDRLIRSKSYASNDESNNTVKITNSAVNFKDTKNYKTILTGKRQAVHKREAVDTGTDQPAGHAAIEILSEKSGPAEVLAVLERNAKWSLLGDEASNEDDDYDYDDEDELNPLDFVQETDGEWEVEGGAADPSDSGPSIMELISLDSPNASNASEAVS